MTRGPKADAEQRDQTRAPRNRDPREAEAGPLVESCPGSARAAAAAAVNDGPVTMYAVGPAGMQDSRIWAASVLNRKRPGSRAERTDTRAAMTAKPAAISRPQRAQADALGECGVWGARLTNGHCPPGSWRTTMRSSRRPARTLPAAS